MSDLKIFLVAKPLKELGNFFYFGYDIQYVRPAKIAPYVGG